MQEIILLICCCKPGADGQLTVAPTDEPHEVPGLQLGIIQRANGLFSNAVFEKMLYIWEDKQIRMLLITQVLDGTVGEMSEVFDIGHGDLRDWNCPVVPYPILSYL